MIICYLQPIKGTRKLHWQPGVFVPLLIWFWYVFWFLSPFHLSYNFKDRNVDYFSFECPKQKAIKSECMYIYIYTLNIWKMLDVHKGLIDSTCHICSIHVISKSYHWDSWAMSILHFISSSTFTSGDQKLATLYKRQAIYLRLESNV